MKRYFPFEEKQLPEKFFRTAQYNTWMEFTYNPTQKSVLEYAHAIVDNGYKAGILMIDEGWSVGYGSWEFDFAKFPDPKKMIDELHLMGFTVMLWVVPYVTLDGRNFLEHYYPWACERAGKVFKPRLARQKNGKVAVTEWWNGLSAILDLTKENDREYLDDRLEYLMKTYGVDGFKFDGGNIVSLQSERWLTEPPETSAEALNKAWNDFGAKYKYHEYKDTYDRSGMATIQRIRDRNHSWDLVGLNTLVPYLLAQGLLGYPYVCPDMIGGGWWSVTLDPDFKCDEELFVRMAQCSALFPMMQFSWAPWRMLGEEAQKLCLEAAKLHDKFADLIVELVNQTPQTGEPIVKSMEYCYPHKGYERITDQFLLGENILVCPVIEKGATTRKVILPQGKWKYCDEIIYDGEQEIVVYAPLTVLPYFTKIED
jgi:alpha-glucosidase (family GH31 glycosyl hydrolase)